MAINFPDAPTNGQVFTVGEKTWSYDGVKWVSLGTTQVVPLSGNAIINGAFDIWQRGTSTTVVGAYTFVSDRWKIFTDTGITSVNTQQTFTPGTAPVAGYEGQYYLRSTKSANSGGWVLTHAIEDVRTFAGQTATLSFWAKADAAVTFTPKLLQVFGSGGSSAVSTSLTSTTLTTSWVRYSMSVAVPSISGKTIGSGSYLDVRPFDITDALAHTIDIWGVQLEVGSVATPFKRNAPSIQAELAACQRYYQRFDGAFGPHALGNGVSVSSTATNAIVVRAQTTLRSAPTVNFGGTLSLYDGGVSKSLSTITVTQASTSGVLLDVTHGSGFTALRPVSFQVGNGSGNWFELSSEL